MTTHTRDAITTHRCPSTQSTLLYWTARATLRQVYRAWPLTEAGIRGLAAVERGFTQLPNPPGVRVKSSELGGVPVVDTISVTTDDQRHDEQAVSKTAVLYLHGGAFLFCGPGTHRRLCSSLAVNLGAPVHAVRYRTVPDVDLGTVVDDVYTAYRGLSEELPSDYRIVVAGDSAGGFLAAKICELSALDGIRRPAALVCFSPLVDLDGDVEEGSWWTRDAFQPAVTLQRAQKLWECPPHRFRGARSLLDCDPEIFPPTMITLAADELVEPDALALTERLHAAGRTIDTHRWYAAVHAFPVLTDLTPESRRAGELAVEFLRRALEPIASQ